MIKKDKADIYVLTWNNSHMNINIYVQGFNIVRAI